MRRISLFVLHLMVLLWVCGTGRVLASPVAVPRHELEIRARTEPAAVLAELPSALAAAKSNPTALAPLHLARANACRVLADWTCQREAGRDARLAAEAAGQTWLRVRGLIAEGRGQTSLRQYAQAEAVFGEAERLLDATPHSLLSADVQLAYSSLSESLGKADRARTYAERGIGFLTGVDDWVIHVRLLRNLARARTQLGDHDLAANALAEAVAMLPEGEDPKLRAELFLELSRSDRLIGRADLALAHGEQVLALASQLDNSQLGGLGHELIGLAQVDLGRDAAANTSFRQAWQAYSRLGLLQDELRALELWLPVLARQPGATDEFKRHTSRLIALNQTLQAEAQTHAVDDLEARLSYAQQDYDLRLLRAQHDKDAQYAALLLERQRLLMALAGFAGFLALVLIASFVSQRRSAARLRQALAEQQQSESRYRMLAEHSRDLVVHMRLNGERLYMSPSVRDMLGYEPEEMRSARFDLVHPDDRQMLQDKMRQLAEQGGTATTQYRVMHRNGEYRWIEVIAQLVPGTTSVPEIIYSGRDITRKIRAEQALQQSEERLRQVSDHLPALVARVDRDERYQFVNAQFLRTLGVDPATVVGRLMRDVHDAELYVQLKPHIDAVLAGKQQVFEGATVVRGRHYHFQTRYVPDLDARRQVQGFFSMTFDISELKRAQAELDRLARVDSLTGLSNRRGFEAGLAAALARGRRQATGLSLLVMDLDRFKQINDEMGHPVGDSVLVAFASRLRMIVRADDLVARLGGDEFVVLVADADAERGEVVAAKIVAAMNEPLALRDTCLRVSCSVGVAHIAQPDSGEALFELADSALYEAKAAGRATWKSIRQGSPVAGED